MAPSSIAIVVFNVATVSGSTIAFSKALQSVVYPAPRLVVTRALMNSHTIGADAMRKLPPMMKTTEIRAKNRSRSSGPSPHLCMSAQEPIGRKTRSTAAAVMLLTVEI